MRKTKFHKSILGRILCTKLDASKVFVAETDEQVTCRRCLDALKYSEKDGKKICTGCGEEKPISEFYFYGGKPTQQCKECYLGKNAAYKVRNPEVQRRHNRAYYLRRIEQKQREDERRVSTENTRPQAEADNKAVSRGSL